jgi:pimeloyl-ACP methyl ester carboxylesterase
MRTNNIAQAHIGGISLGGLIAQDFAARYPQMVNKLILVDTTPRYTDAMREMWAERAEAARTKGVAIMIDALLSIWFSKAAIANNAADVRYVRDTLASCNGEAYALACEALAGADLRGNLPSIAAKTLVVCGDDDIPSFLDAAHLLADTIRNAKLEWIPGTRHASVLESPDKAILMMKRFLEPAT